MNRELITVLTQDSRCVFYKTRRQHNELVINWCIDNFKLAELARVALGIHCSDDRLQTVSSGSLDITRSDASLHRQPTYARYQHSSTTSIQASVNGDFVVPRTSRTIGDRTYLNSILRCCTSTFRRKLKVLNVRHFWFSHHTVCMTAVRSRGAYHPWKHSALTHPQCRTPPTSNPSYIKLSQVGYTHPYSQHESPQKLK